MKTHTQTEPWWFLFIPAPGPADTSIFPPKWSTYLVQAISFRFFTGSVIYAFELSGRFCLVVCYAVFRSTVLKAGGVVEAVGVGHFAGDVSPRIPKCRVCSYSSFHRHTKTVRSENMFLRAFVTVSVFISEEILVRRVSRFCATTFKWTELIIEIILWVCGVMPVCQKMMRKGR